MVSRKTRLLLFSSNIWYLGEGMLGPLFAVFAERIGGSVLDISWAWALYLMVTGLLIMVIGHISDRKGLKERILVTGYALNAIMTFAYLLVSTPMHLFFVQTGLGVAAAMTIPTWNALYAKHSDKKRAGYIWGLAGGQGQLITGIALVIGGFIVTYYSFTVLFLIMGTIQIIAAAYQARILRKQV